MSTLTMRAGVLGCWNLKLESIWRAPSADMQAALMSWTRTRLWEGAERYVRLRRCLVDPWSTWWSEDPFDLFLLERDVTLAPTSVAQVPVLQGPATDPFAWTAERVARRVPNAGSTPGAL